MVGISIKDLSIGISDLSDKGGGALMGEKDGYRIIVAVTKKAQ